MSDTWVESNTAGNKHKVGSDEFRNQRAKDFDNQKINSASDFNFDQYNDNNKGHHGTHISLAEINHLRKNNRNEDGGGRFQENYDVLKAQEDAGAVFGVKAEAAWNKMKERKSRLDAISRSQQHSNGAKPDQVANIKNTQTQDITQDNDITSNVNGNNNTVINEQDNSIRQYGGDNRSFVYNAGKNSNPYESTPVSAATMSGFYDVNDSPGAAASWNDRYTTMNRDNQKRYAGEAMKTFAKYGNTDARSYTNESMENALSKSTQYSFDRADRQTGHVFGDIWNSDYITEDWKMPSAPKAIESNAAEIADKAKDDIEDI